MVLRHRAQRRLRRGALTIRVATRRRRERIMLRLTRIFGGGASFTEPDIRARTLDGREPGWSTRRHGTDDVAEELKRRGSVDESDGALLLMGARAQEHAARAVGRAS